MGHDDQNCTSCYVKTLENERLRSELRDVRENYSNAEIDNVRLQEENDRLNTVLLEWEIEVAAHPTRPDLITADRVAWMNRYLEIKGRKSTMSPGEYRAELEVIWAHVGRENYHVA